MLLLLIPASLALRYFLNAGPLIVFVAAILAIMPLADWIRRATEQLARTLGPGIGALRNVTFRNVAELRLALFVPLEGHANVVKGQITGSIVGNGLLGLVVAILGRRDGETDRQMRRTDARGPRKTTFSLRSRKLSVCKRSSCSRLIDG